MKDELAKSKKHQEIISRLFGILFHIIQIEARAPRMPGTGAGPLILHRFRGPAFAPNHCKAGPQSTIAIILAGPPVPSSIFIGSAIIHAPFSGSRSILATFSNP